MTEHKLTLSIWLNIIKDLGTNYDLINYIKNYNQKLYKITNIAWLEKVRSSRDNVLIEIIKYLLKILKIHIEELANYSGVSVNKLNSWMKSNGNRFVRFKMDEFLIKGYESDMVNSAYIPIIYMCKYWLNSTCANKRCHYIHNDNPIKKRHEMLYNFHNKLLQNNVELVIFIDYSSNPRACDNLILDDNQHNIQIVVLTSQALYHSAIERLDKYLTKSWFYLITTIMDTDNTNCSINAISFQVGSIHNILGYFKATHFWIMSKYAFSREIYISIKFDQSYSRGIKIIHDNVQISKLLNNDNYLD